MEIYHVEHHSCGIPILDLTQHFGCLIQVGSVPMAIIMTSDATRVSFAFFLTNHIQLLFSL